MLCSVADAEDIVQEASSARKAVVRIDATSLSLHRVS